MNVLNLVLPKTKLEQKPNIHDEDAFVLDNHRCKNMIEDVVKQHLPNAQAVVIIWVDKENLVSSAYCNMSPLNRLWVLMVAWLQELFDIRLRRNGKEE